MNEIFRVMSIALHIICFTVHFAIVSSPRCMLSHNYIIIIQPFIPICFFLLSMLRLNLSSGKTTAKITPFVIVVSHACVSQPKNGTTGMPSSYKSRHCGCDRIAYRCLTPHQLHTYIAVPFFGGNFSYLIQILRASLVCTERLVVVLNNNK